MKTLWFYHNQIDDKGVRILVNSPLAEQLQSINLRQVGMSDQGAESVLAARGLDGLQELYVGLNDLSQESHSALLRRFGSALLG